MAFSALSLYSGIMSPFLRLILVFVFSTPFVAFSQKAESSSDCLQLGRSLMKSNPQKAFSILEGAMMQAKRNNEDDVYVQSLNDLSTLVYKDFPEQQKKRVFAWCKHAVRTHSGNTLFAAELYFSTARFYFRLTTERDSAILLFQKALRIRLVKAGDKKEWIAECYHGLGDIYAYRIYDYAEAEKNYEQALLIREESRTSDRYLLASNYYNLAITNRSQHDYEKALPYGFSAIQIATEIHNTIFLEQCYDVVASIYHDMQNSEQARKYYQKAVELNRVGSNSLLLLAWHYEGLGETFRDESEWNKAVENLNKALLLFQQSERSGLLTSVNSQLWLHCQLTLAETYRLKEQYSESHQILDTYFSTLNRLNILKGRQVTDGYSQRGEYYLALKNYDSAFYYFNRAISSVVNGFKPKRITDNPEMYEIEQNYYIHSILRSKASALTEQYQKHHKQEYLIESIKCLKLAEKLLSIERNSLDAEESKQRYSDENYSVYEQLLYNLYIQQITDFSDSLQAEVFYFFEASKAHALRDAIKHVTQTSGFNNADTIVNKLNILQRSWFVLEHQISQQQKKELPQDKIITALRQQQVTLDRRIQKLKEQIEFQFPGYSRIAFQSGVTSLQEVKKFSKKNDRAILECFYGAKSVYAIGIKNDVFEFKRIGSRDSIDLIAAKFLKHFSDDHSSINQQAFQNFVISSRELHRLLVQPFQKLFSDAIIIQVIPDGILNQIPFELLITESPTQQYVNYKTLKYILHQFSLGYAYSSSLLVGDHRSYQNNPTLLAMGFTGGSSFHSPRPRLAEIHGVELELEALKKQFQSGKFLTGSDVTELNFKQLAPDFDIIHLAVHGQGEMNDRFSASLSFQPDRDSVEDGQLHAYELYGIKFKARLAVLTACESGLGKAYKGEGMMSIAAALTYSGCQNTLMSLWKVNDNASVDLTNEFYNRLLEGYSIDHALMMAKLNYLEQADEYTADPVIWAPMIAYGNLESVFKKEKSKTIYIVSGILTVLLFFFILIRSKQILL